jgi:midasin (ATPase involved in ribosome maturation)
MFALNNENENLDRPHDFYRDPLQSEAVKCHPLLKSIKGKVHELMKEWPEHPTLTTVCLQNNRILNFT